MKEQSAVIRKISLRELRQDLETLKEEIAARDYKDSHRETSPLKQAEDAVYLDTTGLNIQEVVEKIKAEAEKRM